MTELELLSTLEDSGSLLETLSRTTDKIEGFCRGCNYYNESRVKAPLGQYDLVVITGAPAAEDTNTGVAFSARKWRIIKKVIAEQQLTSQILNVVLCNLQGGEKEPKIKGLNKCGCIIQKLLRDAYKPKCIVTMGTSALKCLGIKEKNATDNIGRVLSWDGVPVLVTYSEPQIFNYEKGYALFDNFCHHLRRAADVVRNGAPAREYETLPVQIITTTEKMEKAFLSISGDAVVAFDIETAAPGVPHEAGLDYFYRGDDSREKHKMTVFSMSFVDGSGKERNIVIDYTKVKALKPLKNFLVSSIKKVTFNGGFDIGSLQHTLGIEVNGLCRDVMLLFYLVDEGRVSMAITDRQAKVSLKALTMDYLPTLGGYEEEGGIKAALRTDFNLLKEYWQEFLRYAAIDAAATRRLDELGLQWIVESEKLLLSKWMIPVLKALVAMHETGVCIDKEYYVQLSLKLCKELENCKKIINKELSVYGDWRTYRHAFELEKANKRRKNKLQNIWDRAEKYNDFEFEVSKDDHIRRVVFGIDWLGCTSTEKTRKGAIKTNEEALTPLAEKYKLVRAILDYKKAETALTMIKNQIVPNIKSDGRIHSTAWQVGTKTNRLSMREPNGQQMGKATIGWQRNPDGTWRLDEKGRHIPRWIAKVQGGFVPEKGKVFLYSDYSTLEVIVLAYYCAVYDPKSRNLATALAAGMDIHSFVASELFGVPYEEIVAFKETKHKGIRKLAKGAIFGFMYGSSQEGFAKKNNKSLEWTSKFFSDVLDRFPEIKKYIDGIHLQAKTQYYVETLFGGRRHLNILKYEPWNKRVLRQAQNSPIQGTAAEMGKISMSLMTPRLLAMDGEMNLVVHDSCLISVPDNEEAIAAGIKIMHECMVDYFVQNFDWCIIPPRIDVEIGYSWTEKEKVDLSKYITTP